MNDKDIANSVLEMTKHQVTDFTKSALESSGSLRHTLMSMRNQCEQDQAALAQYAIHNNWYLPAAPADQSEVQRTAGFFQNAMMNPTMQ